MQEYNMGWHGLALRQAQPFVEHTLQSKLRHPFLPLNLHPHLKQPIAVSHACIQRRVPAPYYNRFGGFGHDFEVIRYLRSDIVGRGFQLLGRP